MTHFTISRRKIRRQRVSGSVYIDGIGITVVARRIRLSMTATAYHTGAEHPVLAIASRFQRCTVSGNSTIILASDVTVDDGIQMSVTNDTAINFNAIL